MVKRLVSVDDGKRLIAVDENDLAAAHAALDKANVPYSKIKDKSRPQQQPVDDVVASSSSPSTATGHTVEKALAARAPATLLKGLSDGKPHHENEMMDWFRHAQPPLSPTSVGSTLRRIAKTYPGVWFELPDGKHWQCDEKYRKPLRVVS
jgi:hypothetical protein